MHADLVDVRHPPDALGSPVRLSGVHPVSRSRSLTRPVGLVLALVLLLGVVLSSLVVGSVPIPVTDVVRALVAPDGSEASIIVRELRAPRTMIGVAVGAGLALAGAVMQGLTRNPLADPGILGVSAGAAFAVVIAISVLGVGSLTGFVWFGFLGAAVASVGVYALGSLGRDGATPVKLALAGAAVTALLGSLTTAIVLLDAQTLDEYRFWAVGSLAGRDAAIAAQVLPFLAVGVVLALASARALNALSLGDDVARALGQRMGVSRAFGALAVTVLTGAAVAAAGPIGFVGLVVPHVVRAATGPDYRWILPYSAVCGPLLLLVSDILGRVIARPAEVQVGIVTALVGAPFFIAMVRRRRLAQL